MPELIEAAVIISEMEKKSKEMCIRSIHVYKDVWDAVIGNELKYEREGQNTCTCSYDRYAVRSNKNKTTIVVGQLPRN